MDMALITIKQKVRDYIAENFLMGGHGEPLADTDSFMARHVIDSTGFLELITFIEATFDIRIEDEDMVPENLDSLDAIDRFVRGKLPA